MNAKEALEKSILVNSSGCKEQFDEILKKIDIAAAQGSFACYHAGNIKKDVRVNLEAMGFKIGHLRGGSNIISWAPPIIFNRSRFAFKIGIMIIVYTIILLFICR